MGISNYYFRNIKSELVRHDYWDLHLTSDNQGMCLDYATECKDSCSGNFDIIRDGLVVWFDTSNTGSTVDGSYVKSLVEWDKHLIKPSSGITLCDFGLTGVDNGRYNMLSGITVNLTTADTRVILYPVTGYTITDSGTTKGKYDYPWSFMSGTTTPEGCVVGDTICLNGGFYQGFFKLDFKKPAPIKTITPNLFCNNISGTTLIKGDKEGVVYDLMPTEFEDGWSMETWIKWDNTNCNGCVSGVTSGSSATTITCTSGNTLNGTYTGNTGFFFYIGTRSENKFRNIFSGETGLETCTGIPLSGYTNISYSGDGVSWFIRDGRITNSCYCSCPTGDTSTMSGNTTSTYCDQLSENALGFRITPDGKIGYRKMTVVTDCFNNTEIITGTTMEEGYSEINIFETGNTWNHIVVTYTGGGTTKTLPSGTLKFWVNGRVVYRVENFIGLQLRALDEWSDKQLGVPFNISWGGGTQGLLESQTFGGPDPEDGDLDLERNFAGTFDGELSQLRFYEKSLNLLEIRNNFFVDCNRYCKSETFGGSVSVIPNYLYCDDCNNWNYKPWEC